jgi:thiosulfate dehydrogenase (quinone) large subunit
VKAAGNAPARRRSETHGNRRPQVHIRHRVRPAQDVPLPISPAARYVWALARLSLGFVFVWAFADKLFGLGHETTAKQAWIHGGHPTTGLILK